MFGHFTPLDPMAGEPYLWAHLSDDTLTVQALLITEDGGYEIQTYERRLAPHGLDLTFPCRRWQGAEDHQRRAAQG